MEDDSYKGFSIKDAGVSRENLEAAFRALPHEMTAVAVDLAGTFLNTIDRLLVGRTLEAAYRADKAVASPADDEDLACYGVLNEVFPEKVRLLFGSGETRSEGVRLWHSREGKRQEAVNLRTAVSVTARIAMRLLGKQFSEALKDAAPEEMSAVIASVVAEAFVARGLPQAQAEDEAGDFSSALSVLLTFIVAPHMEDMLDSYGKDTDEADEKEDDGLDEDEWPDDPDMPQLFESTAKEILNGTKEVGSRLRPYIVLAFASLVPLMRRAWAERRDDFAETLKKEEDLRDADIEVLLSNAQEAKVVCSVLWPEAVKSLRKVTEREFLTPYFDELTEAFDSQSKEDAWRVRESLSYLLFLASACFGVEREKVGWKLLETEFDSYAERCISLLGYQIVAAVTCDELDEDLHDALTAALDAD